MHIVHVLTRLLRAGSEENTLETCRWQVAAGHRVTLIHGVGYDLYWHRHLPKGIVRIALPEMVHPVRLVQDLRAVMRLREIYRQIRPDVIHTHQSKAGVLGRLAARAVPAAIVVHGIHIVPFEGVARAKRDLYLMAERIVARRTDAFIGVSDTVGRAYLSAGLARLDQVHCVRSGMDLGRFRRGGIPADWRALLGLAPDTARPPVVVMMAAFEPRKHHLGFLRAFAKVAANVPDLRVVFAGAGPMEPQVRAAVIALGLQDQIVFAGHRPDPEDLFALADLSILTSGLEGLPRVVVQSIASGCPALVQDLPGLDEVLIHGTNGWITAQGDMDATVRAMCELLLDPPLLRQLAQGARLTNLTPWELEQLGAQTSAIYDAVARRGRRMFHDRVELAG